MVVLERTLRRLLTLAVLLACGLGISSQANAAKKKTFGTTVPVISPKGGVFASSVVVTLTSGLKEIRYTLDGSEPGTNSTLYSAPILLTNTALIKVRGFESTNGGAVAMESFTFIDANVAGFNSTLPLVVVDTFGSVIPTATNATHWIKIFNAPSNQRATLTNAMEFAGAIKLKPRGFTSLRYPKRSLTMELVDAEGEESPASLLGMPADSDWVLYAPYPDKTLMRDVLAYELSNKLGHYAARTRYVEMFINDSTNKLARAHYAGVYVLEEKVKIGKHRVAIQKLSAKDNAEPDITGGYLFKKDHMEKVGVDMPADGPPRVRAPILASRFPSGPGAFPAMAAGFLPSLDPPVFSNAVIILTNSIAITNVVSGTNLILPPPTVSIVKTNTQILTNIVSVTNAVVATNLLVSTNRPISTNVTVISSTVVSTNAVVATQAVVGTNSVATTNHVDATTAVVTTTTTITTSASYRTNFVVATNTLALTNVSIVTNVVVLTNALVVTNAVITTVPVMTTNRFLATNHYRLGPAELSPQTERLLTTGEGFITSQTNAFFYVEPKATKITPAQKDWLTSYLNRMEAALYGPDFRNPTNGYSAFLDVDSFIDYHLFVEATKNIDGFRFSTFFAKDRGGKLKIEPIWDWNLSLGNARGKQGYMAEHWYWPQLHDQQYPWYRRLFEDPDFGQRYVDRWAQWRTNVFATSNLLARIDALAIQLKEPATRNFERWPILGDTVDPEYFAGKTWEEDIQYMKTWLTNRLAWMDAQFVPPPVVTRAPVAPTTPTATNAIGFIARTGQVYFTTDGSDPRHVHGAVSKTARVYQAPVEMPKATKIVARVKNTNGWSSPVAVRLEE
jgi:hypothetical protein